MFLLRAPALAAVFATALPLLTSCVSQRVLRDRDNQIMQLQEERTDLKKRNRDLQNDLQSYETSVGTLNSALLEANQRAEELAANQGTEVGRLGILTGTRDGNPVYALPQSISFASGSAKLTDQGKGALDALARDLAEKYPDDVYWVEGHTDTDPIKKSSWDSNRDLSIARAMAVLHHLVEEAGVGDDACVVVGHGQYSELRPNDTAEHKALNRRVEIIVKRVNN